MRVLSQANSGQGIARNLGVGHARGEFLTFVDSDDTVPPQSFAHMVDMLRRSGSDFCVGSVRRFKHNEYMRTVWARTVHTSDRLGTTIEEFPYAMQDIIACNRMFRTAFWREKVGDFRGHIAYEDHVPMLTAYVRAEKFDILRKVTYNWRIRENLTSTGQQKARLREPPRPDRREGGGARAAQGRGLRLRLRHLGRTHASRSTSRRSSCTRCARRAATATCWPPPSRPTSVARPTGRSTW